jgi:hypothetical protein
MRTRIYSIAAVALFALMVSNAPAQQKLMLTEICVTPTAQEYAEVWNRSGAPLTLNTGVTIGVDNGAGQGAYFISDANLNYWEAVNGPITGGGAGDGIYQFPTGFTLAPNQVAVVVGSADDFFADAAVAALFPGGYNDFIAQPGSPMLFESLPEGLAQSVLTPDMIVVTTAATSGLSFTNGGESCHVYFWNGQSDLITDIDTVCFGAPSTANDPPNKSAATIIDGPDAGAVTSAYAVDCVLGDLSPCGTDITGATTFARLTVAEGQAGGGNGIAGTDEFTENWSVSWGTGAAISPGTVPPGVPVELSSFGVE